MIYHVLLSPKDLALLIKIAEGYDNLMIIKTIDGKQATAQCIFPDQLEEEVCDMLQAFPRTIYITKGDTKTC